MSPAATPKAPSRRSVIRTMAWTAPVVAVAAAAPAFATSAQRIQVTAFTSKDVSTGQSKKYELRLTLNNDGMTAVTGYQITFTFDTAYGGVTNGGQITGYTRVVSGNTVTYTSTTASLPPGSSTLTFEINTNSGSTADINATVTYASVTSAPFDDTRI